MRAERVAAAGLMDEARFRAWNLAFSLWQCRVIVTVTLAGVMLGLFLPLGGRIQGAPAWLLWERVVYAATYVTILAYLAWRPSWRGLSFVGALVPTMTLAHLAGSALLRPAAISSLFAQSLTAAVFYTAMAAPGFRFVSLLVPFQFGFLLLLDAYSGGQALPWGWPVWIGLAAANAGLCWFMGTRQRRDRRQQFSLAEALESTRHALDARVAEVAQANEALMAERDRATRADQAKTRLLAMVSHELRTPMTGVLGTLELLDDGRLTPDQRALGAVARRSARGLLVLLDSLLDVARLEGHTADGRPAGDPAGAAPYHVHGKLVAIVTLVRPLADARHLSLLTAFDVPQATWLAGAGCLERVALALIENAVKFTPPDGTVQFRAALDGAGMAGQPGTLRLAVQDTGIGIAAEHHARIFEPFAQADDSISRRYGGSGLGLAICRGLVARSGGSLRVESVPGAGSTFHVTMPVTAAEPLPEPDAAVPHGTHALDILLADDDPVSRTVSAGLLRRLGHSVRIAQGGAEALAMLRGGAPPDVVLMDLRMPGMDGLETVRRLRDVEDPRLANLPVIAVTADATQETRLASEVAGLDAVLAKPFDLATLSAALSAVLGPGEWRPAGAERSGEAAPLLDRPYVADQVAILGEAYVAGLMAQYRAAAQATLDALAAAARGADAGGVAALSHRLASSAGAVGFAAVRSRATAVSRAAEDGLADGPDAMQMVADLAELHAASLHEADRQHAHPA